MSLKTRRILYVLFILAFITITPLVMLYAAGYKVSLTKVSLQKTGMIILESKPTGAKIYINDLPQKNFFEKYLGSDDKYLITPAKIKNLEPGEYNVKLELPGYENWGKKLIVRGGETTFAEDINLFKKENPLSLFDGDISFSSISPDKNIIVVSDGEQTILLDISSEETTSLPFEKIERALWSPDSKKIIINNDVFDLVKKQKIVNLGGYLKSGKETVKWGNDNDTIYYWSQNDESLKTFSLSTKISKTLIKISLVEDFLIKNDRLFVITEADGASKLKVFYSTSGEHVRDIEIPSFAKYVFVNEQNKLINIEDKKHQILYIINPESYFPIEEIVNNVKKSEWVDDNRLLYANDFELWIMNYQTRNKDLLTRISTQISHVIWHPSKNYVIYLTENSINILELDNRDKHNVIEVTKIDNPSNAVINKKGNTLYFIGKTKEKTRLYKLTIQ